MYIHTQQLNEIIKTVLKEQDLSLMTDPNRADKHKKLLLYTEYITRYYKLVKDNLDNQASLPILVTFKNVTDFLRNIIADPEFNRLHSLLKTQIAKDTDESGKLLSILSNALQHLIVFANSYNDTLPEAQQITNFHKLNKDFQLFFDSIYKHMNLLRNKFADIPTKNISTTPLPKIEAITVINDLENVALLYLSEMELLFKKFDNIRIESGEYSKKWEEFNLTRGHELYLQGTGLQQNTDPAFSDEVKKALSNHFVKKLRPNEDVASSKKYSFNIEGFITILTNIEKYRGKQNPIGKTAKGNISLQRELQKALSIQASLEKMFGWSSSTSTISKESLEGTLSEKFKEVHTKLWKPAENKYEYDNEIRHIFQILSNARKLYKKTLNDIIKIMSSSKDKELSEIFNRIGPILDSIIKYIQFGKLNIRNIMLNLITNSGANIDVTRYQAMFSKQSNEIVAERLAYWALFQRLGWTKGLPSEEAPRWLYNVTETKASASIPPTRTYSKEDANKLADYIGSGKKL